jgi:hypothetical protein
MIAVGIVSALIALWFIARGDAILVPGRLEVLKYLGDFYGPLLGVLAAFWLAERRPGNSHLAQVPGTGGVKFAAAFLTFWVFAPAVILATSDTYVTALKVLDTAKVPLQPIAAAAVAFAFAKSSPA